MCGVFFVCVCACVLCGHVGVCVMSVCMCMLCSWMYMASVCFQPYFVNNVTGESSWVHPAKLEGAGGLPAGWEEHKDEEGDVSSAE